MGRESPTPLFSSTRALLVVGVLVTAGTGLGLYVAPRSVGEAFAWEIKAPLTAAWMGAFYAAGASIALAHAALQQRWERARIVVVVANVLTWTSLIATIRFADQFRLGDGSGLEQVVAWTWLVVYIAIPVAALAVFIRQERAGGRHEYAVEEPLLRWTRVLLAVLAAICLALGVWLTAAPGGLVDAWLWTLNDLSASILGTWFLTAGCGCAWALREADWLRTRIVFVPFLLTCVLHLIALARFRDTLTGSDVAVAVYAAGIAVSAVALAVCALAQRRLRAIPRASLEPAG
jgi:hypothetical protein